MIEHIITYLIVALLFVGCLRVIYKAWAGDYKDRDKPGVLGLFISMILIAWFVAWIGGI